MSGIKHKTRGELIIISGTTCAGKGTIIRELLKKHDDIELSISYTSRKMRGGEVDGVDYFIAKKILRKFEQLNIAYIRDEIDPYIDFLDKTFGKNKMKECTEYLLRLKKLA